MKVKTKRKFSPFFLVVGIILAIYAVSLILPLLWAFFMSLKDPMVEQYVNMLGLPQEWLFENWATVFKYFSVEVTRNGVDAIVKFPEMLLNSFLFALGNSFIQTTVTFIVAYACARFDFKISKVIYFIVILGMILPIVGSQPSALAVARHLGLYDSILGMYVMKFNFLGMYFLVFYETLRGFPKDYEEAAQIDGATNLSVMVKIMFPLCATTYATVLLLYFIQQWNDYSTPMLFMPNVPTVAYGLRLFDASNSNEITNTPTRLAACIIVALPTLALFVAFHDKLLNNVSIGGVKE